MSFSLLPRWTATSLAGIEPEQLKRRDIQLLMMDFDNTIVPYTTDTPEEKVLSWLEDMKSSGIQLCVVSNSRRSRVVDFCRRYGLECITHAKKPFPKGIRKCLEKFAIAPERCALVGDQIFTDTLGANCAGVCSVLVPAIHNHTIWLKLRHVAELPFIWLSRGRRL